MKNKASIIALLLLTFTKSFAQYADTNFYAMERINQEIFSQQIISGNEYVNTAGTPYLNKDFTNGNIIDEDQKQKYKMPLRFNIYKNVFEVKLDLDTIAEISNRNKFNYEILGRKFALKNIEIEGKKEQVYLEELFSGKKSELFKRYSKKLLPPKKALSSYEKDKPATFVTTEYTMYQISDKSIKVLPRKKKDFYKLFDDKADLVEKYVKKQKLSLKKIEDLVKLFKYFDNL